MAECRWGGRALALYLVKQLPALTTGIGRAGPHVATATIGKPLRPRVSLRALYNALRPRPDASPLPSKSQDLRSCLVV